MLTSGVQAADGGAIHADVDLIAMLSDTQPMSEPQRSAWPRYAQLRTWLASSNLTDSVAAATVFTTQDATSVMQKMRQAVYAEGPHRNRKDWDFCAATME